MQVVAGADREEVLGMVPNGEGFGHHLEGAAGSARIEERLVAQGEGRGEAVLVDLATDLDEEVVGARPVLGLVGGELLRARLDAEDLQKHQDERRDHRSGE